MHPIEDTRVVLYLGEVAYFLKDMAKDVEWMLRAALAGRPMPLRGDEEVDCDVRMTLSRATSQCTSSLSALGDAPVRKQCNACTKELLQDSYSKNQWGKAKSRKCRECIKVSANVRNHSNLVGKLADGGKFLITFASWDSPDHEILARLESAPCRQGCVQLFPFQCRDHTEANPQELWLAYQTYMLVQRPHFGVFYGGVQKIVRNTVIIPVYSLAGSVRVFNVFMPEDKCWGFVGGDVSFGNDATWAHATLREWWEEVGASLGMSWDDAFALREDELLNAFVDGIHCGCLPSGNAFLHVVSEAHKFRQPVTAYLFVHVRPDFFERTHGVHELPLPTVRHVRWDQLHDKPLLRTVHTEGALFMEHSKIHWLTMSEYQVGKASDGHRIWRLDIQLMKTRVNHDWWQWLRGYQRHSTPIDAQISA